MAPEGADEATEEALSEEAQEQISDFGDLDKWASEAIRGANDWLITLRNAEDEGIEPWSDQYAIGEPDDANDTEQDSGILSYSEGLTALTLTDDIAREYKWMNLQPELYREDLKQIIGVSSSDDEDSLRGILTEEGEKPGYNPDPYMQRSLTNNFTDAVSFSTSVLMGVLEADQNEAFDVTAGELSEQHFEDALTQNLNWFIDNRIEVEDGQFGYSWIGANGDKYDPELQNTYNYFTYSAVIPLVDFYAGGSGDEEVELVKQIADEHEEEIVETLEGAAEFLLEQNWEDRQGAWEDPSNRGQPNIMTTCYTIIALSYIDAVVDEINIDAEKPTEAMTWLWSEIKYYEEQDEYSLWDESKRYDCKVEGRYSSVYLDGSGPYLILDAVYEFLNFELGDPEQVVDEDETEEDMEDWARTFAKRVLAKCWAGTEEFPQKGFRHLGQPRMASENPRANPTAIYATHRAIETLLFSTLGGELHPGTNERVDTTEETESESTSPRVVKQHTRDESKAVVDFGDGAVSIAVDWEHEEVPPEHEEVLPEHEDRSEDRNYVFAKKLNDLSRRLRIEYDEHWMDPVCETVSEVGKALRYDWETKFRRKNEAEFLAFLTELYFCPDRDTYEAEVKIPDADAQYLLDPQWEIREEVENEWDDEDFADTETRKSRVEDFVTSLKEEPWGGEEVFDVITEFRERYS